jgi:phosphomannomutase
MHGIGHTFASQIFEVFELSPFKAIQAQKDPDFMFPTVPFPNPEEKGDLDLAKKHTEEDGCDIVLANNPDAKIYLLLLNETDQVASGLSTQEIKIGTMLGHWIGIKLERTAVTSINVCRLGC